MKLNYNIGTMVYFGALQATFALAVVAHAVSAVAQAAGPENVLVVVNANSELSRNIGSYYVQRRSIPAKNVCSIHSPDRESISRAEYESAIAGPVGSCLESKHLTESILYIVTTQG